jgi:peptide-methionine (R)-S-oxide reductase
VKRRQLFQTSAAGIATALVGFGVPRQKNVMATPAKPWEVTKTVAQWRALLTPQQFHILREQGTEPPDTSPLDRESRRGIYHCAGCDLPVFTSQAKFDSGTGWPSFYAPIAGAIGTSIDRFG